MSHKVTGKSPSLPHNEVILVQDRDDADLTTAELMGRRLIDLRKSEDGRIIHLIFGDSQFDILIDTSESGGQLGWCSVFALKHLMY